MSESFFRVSAYDEILEVGGDWVSSDSKSGTAAVTKISVLGRSIWSFISGIDTQSYVNAAFFRVRQTDMPVSLTYRCDTPDMAQVFQMTISPNREETCGLYIHHTLDWQKPWPTGASSSTADRLSLCRCSVCCRYKLGDDWIDPLTMPGTRFVAESYKMCRTCKKELYDNLDQVWAAPRRRRNSR